MKFWKSLSALIDETLPDWRDNFLSYKELKKQLKLIYPKDGKVSSSSTGTGQNPNKRARAESDVQSEAESKCRADSSDVVVVVDKEVTDFVRLLEDEIDKFNAFFVEKEEEYVIKWKELQGRAEKTKDSNEELMKVGREIVDFHGEMVLLENYSALNYTGLVKILKKYDKRSGALIRLPFIQKVLQEPFFSTEVIDKLVKECEMMLEKIFFDDDPSSSSYLKNEENGCDSKMAYEAKASQTTDDKEACDLHTTSEVKGMGASNCEELCDSITGAEVVDGLYPVPKDFADNENMESMYKKTLSALRVLKEVRSGSSTVSVFSLPPLQNNGQDGDQKNTDLQQEYK